MSTRELDARVDTEVELVATRMRETLVEVLGEARGGAMFTREWLIARVHHYAKEGVVFVAEENGAIIGHAMARVEDGVGHFGTIFVAPHTRRHGVAQSLMADVERWLRARDVLDVRYYTDEDNEKLITLFRAHGYAITERDAGARMVKLTKRLTSG
jgi:ribosomal protein S18 acetylase RimI-like enzyme